MEENVVNDIGCSNASYILNGTVISLADIEKILLGTADGERNRFKVAPFDPRMIFAIRPAYWSVQYPHQAPNFNSLEDFLSFAAENFVMQTIKYNKKTKEVTLPEILQAYTSSFGNSDQEMLTKIASYVQNKSWNKTWKSILSSSPKIVFVPFKRNTLRFLPC